MKTSLRKKCLVLNQQLTELQRSAINLFIEIPDTDENGDLLETLDELIHFDFEDHIPEK